MKYDIGTHGTLCDCFMMSKEMWNAIDSRVFRCPNFLETLEEANSYLRRSSGEALEENFTIGVIIRFSPK